jgi:hypothetical protein
LRTASPAPHPTIAPRPRTHSQTSPVCGSTVTAATRVWIGSAVAGARIGTAVSVGRLVDGSAGASALEACCGTGVGVFVGASPVAGLLVEVAGTVAVGGIVVEVGGTAVGRIAVDVGGIAVDVGGMLVELGGTGVDVHGGFGVGVVYGRWVGVEYRLQSGAAVPFI